MKVQQDIIPDLITDYTSMLRGGLCFLLLFVLSLPALAQHNILERISVATRSDGKGYVIRYHLKQKVDSFRVYQPEPDLLQMGLYSSSIDTSNIKLAESNPVFDGINFYEIPFGIGVDLYLNQDKTYKAKVYPDGKSNDLLLALTEATPKEVNYITEGLEPIIWSRLGGADSSIAVNESDLPPVTFEDAAYQEVKDKMKFDVVVLDAGHGGHDPGSIGYKNVKEKNITLAITKKVGEYINKYLPDVKVVYTREDDHLVGAKTNPNITIEESLIERGRIANKADGDLFVSIHCNSSRSRQPHGTEVYFLGLERSKTALEVMKRENNIVGPNGDNADSKLTPEDMLIYELANSGYISTSEKIAGMIDHQFRDRARRRSRGVKQARFVVLYHASMPAILVETGFISNPSEERYLNSDYGQSIIASAIFRAIRNYKETYERSQHFNTN